MRRVRSEPAASGDERDARYAIITFHPVAPYRRRDILIKAEEGEEKDNVRENGSVQRASRLDFWSICRGFYSKNHHGTL